MQPDLVSVVIPVFNDFLNLERCLDALSRQTIRDWMEVVVALDGGDPMPGQLKEKTDKVICGPHAGPASARNLGWKSASGAYVLFTDSDCVPEDNWAEEMVRTLSSGAHAVKGIYSGGGDRVIQRLAQIEFEERYRLLIRSSSLNIVDTYSAGYRREVLEDTGGFDESFPFPDHEDIDLSYRMISKGFDLRFNPGARVHHTHRSTWNDYFMMKFSRGRWRARLIRSFPGISGSDSYIPRSLKIQIVLCSFLIPVVLLIPLTLIPIGIWLTVFLLSTIPLAYRSLVKDWKLVPFVPVFSLWRASALFSGLVKGIFASEMENE